MYTEWTRHLKDQEQIQRFKKQIYRSKEILDHIKSLVEQKIKILDRTETNIEVFDTPNWEHRQAFKNGQRSVLQYLNMLTDIDIKKEKENDRQSSQQQQSPTG